tara:strand:+ start:279 stop:1004 length:726 start_codon:yes stop_codon:yes gene_type:complete
MKTLPIDWVTTGLIDYEYKQYMLLGYLKNIESVFKDKKLYPSLTELFQHRENLNKLVKDMKLLEASFPKTLKHYDLNTNEATYEVITGDDETISELKNIIDYSIPKIDEIIDIGKEIYNTVEDYTNIEHVGLDHKYKREGYIVFMDKKIKIYRYELSYLSFIYEKSHVIKTRLIKEREAKILDTYESIRDEIIKMDKELEIPQTFYVENATNYPYTETVFPVVKRMVMRLLLTGGQYVFSL